MTKDVSVQWFINCFHRLDVFTDNGWQRKSLYCLCEVACRYPILRFTDLKAERYYYRVIEARYSSLVVKEINTELELLNYLHK